MSSSSSFELNDPVLVARGDDQKLEGVIVHLGSVDFASSSSSEGDEWVGIRLTGDSAGQGKNDGTVQGRTYFTCPPNCGIFVKKSTITKRELTKLEELKLRRELGTARASATTRGTTAAATPSRITSNLTSPSTTRTSTPSTTTSTLDASSSSSSSSTAAILATRESTATTTTTTTTSTRDKLEELRQRRAALNARKQQDAAGSTNIASSSAAVDSTTAASPPPATATSSSLPSKNTSLASSTSSLERLDKTGSAMLAPSSAATPAGGLTTTVSQQLDVIKLQQELEQTTKTLKDREHEMDELRRQIRDKDRQVELLTAECETTRQEAQDAQRKATALTMSTSSSHEASEQACRDQMVELQRQISDSRDEAHSHRSKVLELERQVKEAQEVSQQLTVARGEVTALRQEIQDIVSQQETRGVADASHYKERAKLQAEIAAHKRKMEQLEKDKQELEATVEDLTLDKEQLEQEKESLEYRLDELKLDAETAQMEAEQLKIELEDAQATSERLLESNTAGESDAEDVTQALSVQNARLREALIRLREQSSVEKMELMRQLRDAEKDAEAGRAVSSELDSLKILKASMEEQINELKDMVEQGAAFETMVEDLSDRVLLIEDENIALRSTIRELEEAAELTAEMEELQTEEVKALTRDLEGRDTIIRNLEEAIKMQRRREDDFLRTVSNYRTTVATLKQEREALLELQQGGEGEKSKMIASSQNALAKAAQLVSDAAEMRKREAKATLDCVNVLSYKSLALRVESLLPQAYVGPELSAIRGEIQASKASCVASSILEGIASCFGKAIRPSLQGGESPATSMSEDVTLQLSDDVLQKASIMLYQIEFSRVVIDVNTDLIRLLAAGQWPNLLSQEESIDLGSRIGHPAVSIEGTLETVLTTLKEEGSLTPEQSNLEAVRRSLNATMQAFLSDAGQKDGKPIIPSGWNPPGWQLLKDASVAKFTCLGLAAALSVVASESGEASSSKIHPLYSRLEQISSQSTAACIRLSGLDVMNDAVTTKLSEVVDRWKTQAQGLMKTVDDFLRGLVDSKTCENQSEKVLSELSSFWTYLRTSRIAGLDGVRCHSLSPEVDDTWARVSSLARSIRSIDGDQDDVHFLCRARIVEQHLSLAIESEPKLESAKSKLASLEKSVASKTKEVSILTARLSELEKLLAKSNLLGGGSNRSQSLDYRSSDELSALQAENRMLSEAMEVLHRQVDDYENEIRSLKDFKSPGRGNRARPTPRRALTSVADMTPASVRVAPDDSQVKAGVLEATLFRPALQRALQDAAVWKTVAMGESVAKLAPLPSTGVCSPIGLSIQDSSHDLAELTLALANYRIEVASMSLVDLTNRHKAPRLQLQESCAIASNATHRLQSIISRCERQIFF